MKFHAWISTKRMFLATTLIVAASLTTAAAAGEQRHGDNPNDFLATGGNRAAPGHPASVHTSPSNDTSARDVRYNVRWIGVLPGRQNSFLPNSGSINDSRVLAGYCWNFSNIFVTAVPFLWENGTFHALPIPTGWPGAFAFGLNNNNRAFGAANRTRSAQTIVQTPVLWKDGNAINLGVPAGFSSGAALGINNLDAVVGYAVNFATGGYQAFVWSNGQTTQLPLPVNALNAQALGVNDQGTVAGFVDYGDSPPSGTGQFHSILWIPNGGAYDMVDLGGFGGRFGGASHITNDNQVVGTSSIVMDDDRHAYLWISGVLQDLGTLPGGIQSQGIVNNSGGQVLGVADRADGNGVAFLLAEQRHARL